MGEHSATVLRCTADQGCVPSFVVGTAGTGLLTIGEAAASLGVSIATLRRWDAAGKFRARRHPLSNYRLYRPSDVERLKRKLVGGVRGR